MGIVKFLVAIVIILGLHFALWQKLYKDWMGELKGGAKVLLFATCLLIEATITVLIGIYFVNISH